MLIAITGPTGSGKSSVSKELVKELDKSVLIDVDVVKHFIVGGFVYDRSPEGLEQWRLLGDNLGKLAKNYVQNGYKTILEGYIDQEAWEEVYKYVQPDYKFLLLPKRGVVTKRDALRDEDTKLGAETVARHHDHFSTNSFFDEFVKIDSSEDTIEETARKILAQI